ncbi:hypothetical protein V498_05846 [Pseudogymnoascus sp. VKM F-4517 (FW-2822)]|nr:hypothetical protein V498_05846 [Pseudogymnoascus sp. VKM F-4517 (FW-2822)]
MHNIVPYYLHLPNGALARIDPIRASNIQYPASLELPASTIIGAVRVQSGLVLYEVPRHGRPARRCALRRTTCGTGGVGVQGALDWVPLVESVLIGGFTGRRVHFSTRTMRSEERTQKSRLELYLALCNAKADGAILVLTDVQHDG